MREALFIRVKKEFHKVLFSEIIFIESGKNYVQIVTTRTKYLVRTQMSRVEAILPAEQFCRIHRCFIVAITSVSGFNHDFVHVHGRSLSIGERYRKLFFERILTLEDDLPRNDQNNNMDDLLGGDKLTMN